MGSVRTTSSLHLPINPLKYSHRSDLDVTNDVVLKRLLEKIRRLSRKVQTDEHIIATKNQTTTTTTSVKSTTPTKGIAVSKEARRIDEKVRQMRLKDDSTDHKVAMGRADYISFTQYGPVGKRAISDLAILLLYVAFEREAREFLFSFNYYSLISLTHNSRLSSVSLIRKNTTPTIQNSARTQVRLDFHEFVL